MITSSKHADVNRYRSLVKSPIVLWKVVGASFKPNGTIVNSHLPKVVINAVIGWSSRGDRYRPISIKSSVVMYWAFPPNDQSIRRCEAVDSC